MSPDEPSMIPTARSTRPDCDPCLAGSSSCLPCSAGAFQREAGSTACDECVAGHWCAEGAPAPLTCPAGTFSSAVGLSSSAECDECPGGHFCLAGSIAPTPCPVATKGEQPGGVSEAAACKPCQLPSTSVKGSTSCDSCEAQFYALPRTDSRTELECRICEPNAECPLNTTLATMILLDGHWRLSVRSKQVVACAVGAVNATTGRAVSPCRGGVVAGIEGSDYCAAGHTGPACELCTAPRGQQWFDKRAAQCVDCPKPGNVMALLAGPVLGTLALLLFLYLVMTKPPPLLVPLRNMLHRLMARVLKVALMPKIKLLLGFYQVIMAVPGVYNVHLPHRYYEWMRHFDWIEFLDLSKLFVPGACLATSYELRVLVYGLAPLLGMLGISCLGVLFQLARELCLGPSLASGRRLSLGVMLLNTLPYLLFIAFCLVTAVSDAVFTAWSCVTYFEDTDPAHRVMRSFLKADLSIECGSDAHERVVQVAWIFVGIWSIGMPLAFFLLLLLCRGSIVQRRRTRLVRATAFLHSEYTIACYWWESLYLLERVSVVGFIQFVEGDVRRLITALFVTVLYMVLLLLLTPYRRIDLNVLAACTTQFGLIIVLAGGMLLKMWNNITDVRPRASSMCLPPEGCRVD